MAQQRRSAASNGGAASSCAATTMVVDARLDGAKAQAAAAVERAKTAFIIEKDVDLKER